MHCTECGTSIPAAAKFCSSCGSAVAELAAVAAGETASSSHGATRLEATSTEGQSGGFVPPARRSEDHDTAPADTTVEPARSDGDWLGQAAKARQADIRAACEGVGAPFIAPDGVLGRFNEANDGSKPPLATRPGATSADAPPVMLADGEVVMKDYTVTKARGPFGAMVSRLVVTDARVIYAAESRYLLGSNRYGNEIQIADVAGISRFSKRGISGTVLGWLGVFLLFSPIIMIRGFGTFMFLLGVSAAMVAWSLRRRNVEFEITTKTKMGGGIRLSHTHGGIIREFASWYFFWPFKLLARWLMPGLGVVDSRKAGGARPTAEAEAMFDEIGAVILDIQHRGTLAE